MNQPEEEQPDVTKLADQLRDADLDYKFAQLFTHSGDFLIIAQMNLKHCRRSIKLSR